MILGDRSLRHGLQVGNRTARDHDVDRPALLHETVEDRFAKQPSPRRLPWPPDDDPRRGHAAGLVEQAGSNRRACDTLDPAAE